MSKRVTHHPNRNRRRMEAIQRQIQSSKLSTTERLNRLDKGGYVAKRERIRLG